MLPAHPCRQSLKLLYWKKKGATKVRQYDYSQIFRDTFIKEAIDRVGAGIVITDPSLEDNPIIYVNKGFETLTNYQAVDILGKNCRFLQQGAKDQLQLQHLRNAIAKKESIVVTLKNYRKNGEMFWNELSLYPIYIGEEKKLFFVGIQKDITVQKESEQLIKEYIDEINNLSTPIISVQKNASVLPLIGNLTEERFSQMVTNIAEYAARTKENYFIIDLQGLLKYDETVQQGIIRIKDILALMGTELIITGMQVNMAIDTIEYTYGKKLNMRVYPTCRDALEAISATDA